MKILLRCFALFAVPLVLLTAACDRPPSSPSSATTGPVQTIRVAVIGGMTQTGFWAAFTDRFTKATNHRFNVVLVSTGPKDVISDAFKDGQADLITMHSSDSIINLVADGYAIDLQPWLKNDLIIVGPPTDPAHIQGLKDAGLALAKIQATKSPFVVHSSLGAQEVMRDVAHAKGLDLTSDYMTILFSDRAKEVLPIAAEKHAYTLIGRIPFRTGKLPNAGLVDMVHGDPLMRRPYLVAVANPKRFPDAHVDAAKEMAAFMIRPETQSWIATYGVGQMDDQPLFFPVTISQ